MASEEHKKLSAFIKETHSRLRQECQLYGPQEAWSRHLSRTKDLKNYAESMRELATSHWAQNSDPLPKNTSTHCRIQWIKRQCCSYYFEGGKSKYDDREVSISSKIEGRPSSVPRLPPPSPPGAEDPHSIPPHSKIKILDVGSCYNPLGDDERFDVTPIDLAPSSNQVLKCDFLAVRVGGTTEIKDHREMIQLGSSSYDVCVFSLLLEYLPSPDQRFHCCEKAHSILKPGGLLIIVTPDSKHVGANARIMKSWRFVLSRLGFMRVTYEKLKHVHCICFRKCFDGGVAARWAQMQVVEGDDLLFRAIDKIFIPQDFQEIKPEDGEGERRDFWSDSERSRGFEELPEFFD
ncbi:S-adenosylmethionine sensor upstream of mTORC1 [Diachasma alloeum]|uniref:S-adenosylmethionine sensor upstream of mTORC1 n=1 Tax=Diachasma alloeum TaxID=454923 RepID=UPI0007384710|nr:S-adenosylmethionine sensor upstream of mTORC1 [Diachasma alloeum]